MSVPVKSRPLGVRADLSLSTEQSEMIGFLEAYDLWFVEERVERKGLIPAERLKILREAYDKAARDPELLIEVKKLQLVLDPATGQELQALAAEVLDQPPDVVRRVKNILGK